MPLPEPEYVSSAYALDVLKCHHEQLRYFVTSGCLSVFIPTPAVVRFFPSMVDHREVADFSRIKTPVQWASGRVYCRSLVILDSAGAVIKEEGAYPGPGWEFLEDDIRFRIAEVRLFMANDGKLPDSQLKVQEEIDSHIIRLREAGTPINAIAASLKERGLTLLEIGRKLDLGSSSTKKEINALKTKVSRLAKKACSAK